MGSAHSHHEHGHHHSSEHCSDLIAGIISEFSAVLAFSRNRWSRYAEEVHPGLSGIGMMVLQVVMRRGPVTAKSLSKLLDMDKSLLSRHITKLRELDLVVATESPEDRRVQLLTVSDHANELLDHVRSLWASSYRERFDGWTDEELESLRSGLHRFNVASGDANAGSEMHTHANDVESTE